MRWEPEGYASAMKLHYEILAVARHGGKPTHEELAAKVNQKLGEGYALLGQPFFGEKMMYQAVTKLSKKAPVHPRVA